MLWKKVDDFGIVRDPNDVQNIITLDLKWSFQS